jgi:hypothetical protein
MTEDRQQREEAERRAALARLDRLRHEGDGLLTSAMPEPHTADGGTDTQDPAELWGRRIGRALAFLAAIAALIYLWATYLR